MKNVEIIRKINKTPCYCCSEIGGKAECRSTCKACNGTGQYQETHYIHIVNGIAIDGDTIK